MINLRGVYFVRSEWLTMAQGSCMLWAEGPWMVWRPLLPRDPRVPWTVEVAMRWTLGKETASLLWARTARRYYLWLLATVERFCALWSPVYRGGGEADPGLGGCLVTLERSFVFCSLLLFLTVIAYRWAFFGVMPRVCLGICVYLGLWRWRWYWPWVREDAAVSSPGERMAFCFLRLKIIGDIDGYCWPFLCFYNIFPLLCVYVDKIILCCSWTYRW